MFVSKVGSTKPLTAVMHILDEPVECIVERAITYTPGLYAIFDDIISDAVAHKQSDPNMDKLDIVVDAHDNHISVRSNGKGIPIVMNEEHKVYVPSMIFGQLLTVSGSTFGDNAMQTTGGRVRTTARERCVTIALLVRLLTRSAPLGLETLWCTTGECILHSILP
jgi:DNA topoisomerase II